MEDCLWRIADTRVQRVAQAFQRPRGSAHNVQRGVATKRRCSAAEYNDMPLVLTNVIRFDYNNFKSVSCALARRQDASGLLGCARSSAPMVALKHALP